MKIPGAQQRRLCLAPLFLLAACSGDSPSDSGGATTIAKIAGDNQAAAAGTLLPLPVRVEVRGASGVPLANVAVQFSIVAGDGATRDTVVTTTAGGVASTEWYLGTASSVTNVLRAAVGSEYSEFSAQSQLLESGATYFGASQYMEYLPGDLPIIISAPHGGSLTPTTIPDRSGAAIETARDSNTEELARTIRDVFFQRTGHRPHVIICRLRRTKLDANREIVEAAQGNRSAQRAWYEFHHFIEAAAYRVNLSHPRGLVMDLHGHAHTIARLELGYLLTSGQLQLSDATLATATYANVSSIRALVQSSGSTLPQLLRGPFSLGTLFELEGFPAVPSASQPDPGAGNDYFNGGYNTVRHGSRDGGNVSGFQLEANFAGVRDTQANRLVFAESLVDVLLEFMSRNLGITP